MHAGLRYPRDLADRGLYRLACLDQGGEPPAGWHPAHAHQVIAYPATGSRTSATPRYTSGANRRLSSASRWARRRACFRRAEIQEAEVDRLLQLVRAIPGEEHHGRMRFRDIRVALMRGPAGIRSSRSVI